MGGDKRFLPICSYPTDEYCPYGKANLDNTVAINLKKNNVSIIERYGIVLFFFLPKLHASSFCGRGRADVRRENSTDRRRAGGGGGRKRKGIFDRRKRERFFSRSRVARPSLLLPPLFFSSICPARSRPHSFFFLFAPSAGTQLVGGRQCARARGPCGTRCCYAHRWRSRSWSRPTLRLLTVSMTRAFLFVLARRGKSVFPVPFGHSWTDSGTNG